MPIWFLVKIYLLDSLAKVDYVLLILFSVLPGFVLQWTCLGISLSIQPLNGLDDGSNFAMALIMELNALVATIYVLAQGGSWWGKSSTYASQW